MIACLNTDFIIQTGLPLKAGDEDTSIKKAGKFRYSKSNGVVIIPAFTIGIKFIKS